jgi:hypothetical protein
MVVNIKRKINKSLDNTRSKLDKSLDNTKAKLKKTARNVGASPPANVKVVKEILVGRNDYPVKVLNILKRYGNQTITAVRIKRTPVSRLLTSTLSAVSSEFGKRLKESPYDDLFHLFLEIKMSPSGKKCYIEKNEVIAIHVSQGTRPREEVIVIQSIPEGITLDSMMNKTKQRMGSKFFTYSANNNNCQDFIVAILGANKIGSAQDVAFVKQNTAFLFQKLSYLRKFSNTVTAIGARVDVVKNAIGV